MNEKASFNFIRIRLKAFSISACGNATGSISPQSIGCKPNIKIEN